MIKLDLEKVELLKNKIHLYKEKMKMASSCTIDAKRKVVDKSCNGKLSKNKEVSLEDSFLSEGTN